mgnify:CR=1 FL=1
MDMPKNNVFNVSYTSVLEKTSVKKKKEWTSKLKKFIKSNKLITGTITIFIMCFVLNVFLVYSFMNILKSI